MEQKIGAGVVRKDAWLKVTGRAKFNDDDYSPACLEARLLTSVCAHAKITSIDATKALALPGVRAVVTGADCGILTGSVLRDMPVLATGVTRYFGEPVAIVVADEERQAAQATKLIEVAYEMLPVTNSIDDAMNPALAPIHPALGDYQHMTPSIYPQAGTNIANHTKIRKGDMEDGWRKSEIIIDGEYSIPQANHAYIETRNARAEILPTGQIVIHSSTQAPHATRALLASYFGLMETDIIIHAPFVGGGYGGKVCPHPEMLAYLASKAVGGRAVRLALTREESFYSSACKIGATSKIRLGADKTGRIWALEADYFVDAGAYVDTSPIMARAMAVSCGGAYHVPNIQCDCLCLYTNHVYTTSFRGFGHGVSTFAIERTIEKLAEALQMDPADLRLKNAPEKGAYTATQDDITLSNTGNLTACITRLKELMDWERGTYLMVSDTIVRAKAMACFSKTSSSPTDASSSAIVTFCSDGSVNLNCGVVECGPGMTTSLPQILAQRLKMNVGNITMNMQVNTHDQPEHWKTVASMSLYMAGNAIIAAADDAVSQIKSNAAIALRCAPEDLDFDQDTVFLAEDPARFVKLKDVVFGVKYPGGNAAGSPVVGRGSFIMKHLSSLDPETGKGRSGPYWTVGAQAVELEYDLSEHTYRLVKAVTVLDAGKVISPICAAGQVLGAMNTGLSIATREKSHYSQNGEILDTSFRTYKLMHYAETPEFVVSFIETPNLSGPFGARGLGEHGVLGMPPALANALAKATGQQFDALPITFETVWKVVNGRVQYAGI
ncbi:xanthine dehydrogenase family protein molybdopterin-binding subunit [Oscillospiraceae bacterium WX1]